MSGAALDLVYTVYMDRRDVTKWVTSLEVRQPPRCLYREFRVTLAGWSNLQDDTTWDIFGTADPTAPRAECLIRAGVLPPDRERSFAIGHGQVPTLTVHGYDHVWLAQRRGPAETMVIAPAGASVERILEERTEPLGRYRIWRASTFHAALSLLANRAGFNVQTNLPDYDLAPFVLDPTASYWQTIRDLVKPWAPEIFYRRTSNTLIIADPLARAYAIGRVMSLSETALGGLRSLPITQRRVRRVITRTPSRAS